VGGWDASISISILADRSQAQASFLEQLGVGSRGDTRFEIHAFVIPELISNTFYSYSNSVCAPSDISLLMFERLFLGLPFAINELQTSF
jgi:hypothetical protein